MAEYLEPYYQIGEVSHITGLTILTLRYYDQINLLKPSYTDPDTKYRFYSQRQIYYLSLIKEFKDLGYKLSDIKELLERDYQQMYKQLTNKVKSIDKQILKLQDSKKQIEERIKPFEIIKNLAESSIKDKESSELKFIDSRKIISIRKVSKSGYFDMVQRFLELRLLMEKLNLSFTSQYFSIFYDDYLQDEDIPCDIEVCSLYNETDNIESTYIKEIPKEIYLTHFCRGDHNETKNTYSEMLKYINCSNLIAEKFIIKVYHISYLQTNKPNKLLSEIQIPISEL